MRPSYVMTVKSRVCVVEIYLDHLLIGPCDRPSNPGRFRFFSRLSIFRSIFALTRGLKYRGKMDGNEQVEAFAESLEQTIIKTVEAGYMTKDLALLVGDQQGWLSTEGFLDTVAERFAEVMKDKV